MGKTSWRRVIEDWESQMQHECVKLNLSISIKIFLRQHRGQLALNVRDAAQGHVVRQREEMLGFSEHQRDLLSSNFWVSEQDGKHWQCSFVKDQAKRYSKEEGSAAFHKLWEKNPYVSVKPYFNPHFSESIWNPKNFQIFLFILSVFKLLATECHLLKTGSLWFDVCYFTYLPLRRKWSIIRKVYPIFPHTGKSWCKERD